MNLCWEESPRGFSLVGDKNIAQTLYNTNNDFPFLGNCHVLLKYVFSHGNNIEDLVKLCGNGSNVNILKWKCKTCIFSNEFFSVDKILSSLTKQISDRCSNVIYFVTCLTAHQLISKKWCFEKYCSHDQECQFSALWGTPRRSYLGNLTIDNKFIQKRVRLFIHQTISTIC